MPNTKFFNFKAGYLALKRQAELELAGKVNNEVVWKERPHEHVDACEIALVVQGNGVSSVNGVWYPFQKGDLLIYNDRVTHMEDWMKTSEPPILFYVVLKNFSVEGMEDNKLIPGGVSPVLGSAKSFSEIKNLFESILGECERQDLGYEIACKGLLQALLTKVLRIINDQFQSLRSGNTHSLERQIREYIEQNYMCDLSLKDIAGKFYISQYYLDHLYKEYCGDSPINYLIKYRLEQAKRLLLTTEHSVKNVASMTGYESLSYFCLAFKKATGKTPMEFRNAFKVGQP